MITGNKQTITEDLTLRGRRRRPEGQRTAAAALLLPLRMAEICLSPY